ncbi:MAG: hypothetical protein HY370_04295 [Proteobacteria bacterium]|nr:hypothetical protein [Pseudomonadota bacterium]
MQADISKMCADFLRAYVLSETNENLKATHARELTAAFFGYKSHAALLAEKKHPLHQLEKAAILVPDIALMDARRGKLEGLPPHLPDSKMIARKIVDFLDRESLFTGTVWWVYDTLENYIIEEFLPEYDYAVMDDLSGQMAETNALFDETYYEEAIVDEDDDGILVSVTGQCNGTSDQDKPFSGDQIDLTVTVEMSRAAGRNAYFKPHIKADGAVNWDWADVDEPQLERGA